MSDNLALAMVRAMTVPGSPFVPVHIARDYDWLVWSSNGVTMDQHTRREDGDRLALTFRHPLTGEEAILHFCRDVVPGQWYCREANAAVTDEVMLRALDASPLPSDLAAT